VVNFFDIILVFELEKDKFNEKNINYKFFNQIFLKEIEIK